MLLISSPFNSWHVKPPNRLSIRRSYPPKKADTVTQFINRISERKLKKINKCTCQLAYVVKRVLADILECPSRGDGIVSVRIYQEGINGWFDTSTYAPRTGRVPYPA